MLDHKHILYCQSNGQGKSYLAIGMEDCLEIRLPGKAFDELAKFLGQKKAWVFGYFSYDLKNEVEGLSSKNEDGLEFPEMIFFRPELVLSIQDNHYAIEHNSKDYSSEHIEKIFKELPYPTRRYLRVELLSRIFCGRCDARSLADVQVIE